VIIGYNFFNLEEGCFWDSPVCTDMLDELQLNEGTYDEAYIDLNTTVVDDTAKPTIWTLTTIMDSKFKGDLDGGSIGADGFNVNKIQLYRTIYGTSQWNPIGQFEYNPDFNVYNYVDRYVQNGASYQYAIVPVANEVQGDKLVSDIVKAEFEGIFITDRKENRRLEYDISLGDVTYNTNSAINQPINNPYPIVTFGNSKYRSGTLSVLPLSKETIAMAGSGIDKLAEQINRQEWLDFLNNGRAKVVRMDSGVLMLVVTHNANVSHKDGDILRHLASISFDYTEIGEINLDMLSKNDLIPSAYKYKTTFDDNGGIISG
jgi:hypothetical protein